MKTIVQKFGHQEAFCAPLASAKKPLYKNVTKIDIKI